MRKRNKVKVVAKRKYKKGKCYYLLDTSRTWESETDLFSSFSLNCKYEVKSNSEVEITKLEETDANNEANALQNNGNTNKRRILFIPVVEGVYNIDQSFTESHVMSSLDVLRLLNGEINKPLGKTGKSSCDQKPFSCEICQRQFSRKHHLKLHNLIHTGEKSFICDICQKAFSRKDNLKLHKFTHSGEKPFICEFCESSFSQRRHLKLHQLTHTGEKSFICEFCQKSFSRKDNLKLHRLTHSGGKPLLNS